MRPIPLSLVLLLALAAAALAAGPAPSPQETQMAPQAPSPEPLIVQRGELLLAGTRYAGDNKQGEIPAMWQNEFFPKLGALAPLITEKDVFYGVGRALPGAMPGHFQYLAAAPVKSLDNLPKGMVGWKFPPHTYAVFPAHGVADIGRVNAYYDHEWLPKSSFVRDGDYMLEYYPPGFADQRLYLYFPVKPKQAGAALSRVVLEGVPKIGYGIHLSPFPGSLYAVLQYLKDPCDYDYIMGVSGAAFRRTWNRDDGGNIDLSYFGEEPFRAIFDALGYGYRMVPPKDRAAMIQALKESIARKKPVLAFGVVGPPECGIVAGYDANGEVLIGYSYFQDGKLPGYYEQADWFSKASWNGVTGFIVLGDRKPKPAPRALVVSSLERAIRYERMTTLGKDHSAGLAAYDDWAKGLEVDADYPKDDAKVIGTRIMVHGDQCVMLEERRDAAKYLRRMAKAAPEAADELNAAAACYDQVSDQGAKTWPWGERYSDVGSELADPAARRSIAAAVRTAKEKETEAVAYLEKALAKLK